MNDDLKKLRDEWLEVLDKAYEEGRKTGPVYTFHVNIDDDERFHADVRDPNGKTVFQLSGNDLGEGGLMKDKNDIRGLEKFLEELSFFPEFMVLRRG